MRAWLKARHAARKAKPTAGAPATETAAAETMTRVILADIALRTGGALLRRGVERSILGQAPAVVKAAAGAKLAKAARPRRGLGKKLLTAAATRVAMRSVPGAIVVGGALLAKSLYDRKHARKPRT
jgi:hypothetical protein